MRRAVTGLALLALTACSEGNFPVYKPGASRAEMDRDQEECRERAALAKKARIGGRDATQAYNRNIIDCLRDRGYRMSGE